MKESRVRLLIEMLASQTTSKSDVKMRSMSGWKRVSLSGMVKVG